MSSPPSLLLVALSARVLAQSAARAGLKPLVLDLFGDEDTRLAAACCVAVPARDQGFDESALLASAQALAGAGGALVYGGGIDTRPELLERLKEGWELLGNPPETLRAVKTPARFFALLDELGIAYPQTRFSPPPSPQGWLLKRRDSEGGWGVGPLSPGCGPVPEGAYFQRRMKGRTFSVLFLADGREALIIGFNTLLIESGDAARPYRFAGAINCAAIDDSHRDMVSLCARRLTQALGLVGLNGLDFMLEGTEARVLELNPRPTATLQLYDPDHSGGWLRDHMAACRGRLISGAPRSGLVRGFRVVFADQRLQIPQAIAWPPWCEDRPSTAAAIAVAEPLCTVTASGRHPLEVERALAERQAQIRLLISTRCSRIPEGHSRSR